MPPRFPLRRALFSLKYLWRGRVKRLLQASWKYLNPRPAYAAAFAQLRQPVRHLSYTFEVPAEVQEGPAWQTVNLETLGPVLLSLN